MKGSNFLAFLGGAIIGGAVALLLAPQSGEKTRELIKDFVDDAVDDMKEFTADAVENVKNTVAKGVGTAKDFVCREGEKLEGALKEADKA